MITAHRQLTTPTPSRLSMMKSRFSIFSIFYVVLSFIQTSWTKTTTAAAPLTPSTFRSTNYYDCFATTTTTDHINQVTSSSMTLFLNTASANSANSHDEQYDDALLFSGFRSCCCSFATPTNSTQFMSNRLALFLNLSFADSADSHYAPHNDDLFMSGHRSRGFAHFYKAVDNVINFECGHDQLDLDVTAHLIY